MSEIHVGTPEQQGEAMSVFLNDFPTVRYLDSVDYYIGRALQGQGKKEAARASYKKFLDIKAKADQGQAMVEDAKLRLGGFSRPPPTRGGGEVRFPTGTLRPRFLSLY
jgi:hypothetical protein